MIRTLNAEIVRFEYDLRQLSCDKTYSLRIYEYTDKPLVIRTVVEINGEWLPFWNKKFFFNTVTLILLEILRWLSTIKINCTTSYLNTKQLKLNFS